jgi:hypothetical protein
MDTPIPVSNSKINAALAKAQGSFPVIPKDS